MTQHEWLNAAEVRELLGISRNTLYRWLQAGRLRGSKPGHAWRFRRADVERLLILISREEEETNA